MTELVEKLCEECGKSFVPVRKTQRFCTNPTNCKRNWHSRDWRRRNPEGAKAHERKNRERHGPEINARVKAWREKNKEYVLLNDRDRHQARKETANASRSKLYFSNHEQNKADQRVRCYQARVALPWRPLLHSASDRAKAKNLTFELTAEWALARWTGKCEITGIPFRIGVRRPNPRLFAPSIDRIVPNKGYTQENSRFILWAINAMKGEGTDSDILEIAMAMCEV